MDKDTTFNTINSILGKKYNFTLPFSDEARALICKCESEQMHKVMHSLYATKNSDEELVKKKIASINKDIQRTIGFEIQRD